ncbi:hypothetical protein ACFYE1_16665 [Kocuria sp. CPCC 205315]
MTELLYEWMTITQAAAALEEYLAERDPALQQLRTGWADHGLNPEEKLDGTVGSVVSVWEWITTRVTELGVDPRSLTQDPTRPGWPSWARHGMLVDPHPPAESLALVDGFASYLGQILTTAVPEASWQIGHHRINDFPMLHRPVLAGAEHQVFLPGLPIYSAYQSAQGRDPMSGVEMVEHVRRTISALRGQGPEAATAEEPYVTVVPEVDCFDVGLRADIAENHSALVDRMIAELTDRDGVESVHRYGPAALVVNAPSWEELRLQMWLTLWLQRHLPADS